MNDDELSSFILCISLQHKSICNKMTNIDKFGKVTHDNLPQAVEHLINLMSFQVEQQIESDSSPYPDGEDELDIKQASIFLKKSQSTLYRYTCNQSIPFYKIGNSLRFSKTELLKWKKSRNAQSMDDKGINR